MKVVKCIHALADIAAKNGFTPRMEKLGIDTSKPKPPGPVDSMELLPDLGIYGLIWLTL